MVQDTAGGLPSRQRTQRLLVWRSPKWQPRQTRRSSSWLGFAGPWLVPSSLPVFPSQASTDSIQRARNDVRNLKGAGEGGEGVWHTRLAQ